MLSSKEWDVNLYLQDFFNCAKHSNKETGLCVWGGGSMDKILDTPS